MNLVIKAVFKIDIYSAVGEYQTRFFPKAKDQTQ